MMNCSNLWNLFDRKVFLLSLLLSLLPIYAEAFNTRPETTIDGQIIVLKEKHFSEWVVSDLTKLIVKRYTEPVHEIITNKAWGCKSSVLSTKADEDECSPRNAQGPNATPSAILAGAQWNDNPYFQLLHTSLDSCRNKYIWLPAEPVCWGLVIKKGEKDAHRGAEFNLKSGDVLLLRSHFGDLQFLHSMRSSPNETTDETKQKVLLWAQFMWNAALGKYDRGTTIGKTEMPALTRYFYPSDTMQRIFFRGNPAHINEFPQFAFGSLLHMVVDSFSTSHVIREVEGSDGSKCPKSEYYRPARIIAFQYYVEQNTSNHAEGDTYVAMSDRVIHDPANAVSVAQVFIDLFKKKADWASEVEPYLQCVYDVTQ